MERGEGKREGKGKGKREWVKREGIGGGEGRGGNIVSPPTFE